MKVRGERSHSQDSDLVPECRSTSHRVVEEIISLIWATIRERGLQDKHAL